MKGIYMVGLVALILGGGLIVGCLEDVLDPELDFEVLETMESNTAPPPGNDTAEDGNQFLYVKVRVENQNEEDEADLTIWPGSFKVDNNADVDEEGSYLANENDRRIDSIRVDPETTKTFWVVFEVPEDQDMVYIRYVGTLDEPIEKEL